MEIRLILAYTLIAVIVLSLVFAGIMVWRKRTRNHKRDSGRGPHNGR